jgi:hypothetical protein
VVRIVGRFTDRMGRFCRHRATSESTVLLEWLNRRCKRCSLQWFRKRLQFRLCRRRAGGCLQPVADFDDGCNRVDL